MGSLPVMEETAVNICFDSGHITNMYGVKAMAMLLIARKPALRPSADHICHLCSLCIKERGGG